MRDVFNVSEESRYSREYFTTQDMEQFCFPAWSRKDILLLGKSKSKKKRKKEEEVKARWNDDEAAAGSRELSGRL